MAGMKGWNTPRCTTADQPRSWHGIVAGPPGKAAALPVMPSVLGMSELH